MNKNLIEIISDFVSKAKGTSSEGQVVDINDLNKLNQKLSNPLPDWFLDLYSKFPLAGSQIDFPQYESDDDFDGYVTIELATPQNIYDEMEKCYPGLAIKNLGYFCIGIETVGSGDQYYTTHR